MNFNVDDDDDCIPSHRTHRELWKMWKEREKGKPPAFVLCWEREKKIPNADVYNRKQMDAEGVPSLTQASSGVAMHSHSLKFHRLSLSGMMVNGDDNFVVQNDMWLFLLLGRKNQRLSHDNKNYSQRSPPSYQRCDATVDRDCTASFLTTMTAFMCCVVMVLFWPDAL